MCFSFLSSCTGWERNARHETTLMRLTWGHIWLLLPFFLIVNMPSWLLRQRSIILSSITSAQAWASTTWRLRRPWRPLGLTEHTQTQFVTYMWVAEHSLDLLCDPTLWTSGPGLPAPQGGMLADASESIWPKTHNDLCCNWWGCLECTHSLCPADPLVTAPSPMQTFVMEVARVKEEPIHGLSAPPETHLHFTSQNFAGV